MITATVPGTGIDTDSSGNVTFNPPTQNQRAGLQLVNGVVYIAFASFSDTEPYHGWLFAYDAATLKQLAALNLSPNSEGAGLWQAGAAPTADAEEISISRPATDTTSTLPAARTGVTRY